MSLWLFKGIKNMSVVCYTIYIVKKKLFRSMPCFTWVSITYIFLRSPTVQMFVAMHSCLVRYMGSIVQIKGKKQTV